MLAKHFFSALFDDLVSAPCELTEREREVVSLIAFGHTNAEIVATLHISEKTVETPPAHVCEKLGLHTQAELVRFAIEHGLVHI